MLSSQATFETEKGSRYLKALCNHFNRKVDAEYTDNHGEVRFGFGFCEMLADDNSLSFNIEAEDAEHLERVKDVIVSHLVRFMGDEELDITWADNA